MLEDELERIRASEADLGKNGTTLQEKYHRILDSLDREFDLIYGMLQFKQKEMKEKAMEAFSRANDNTRIGKEEANWWKNYLGSLRHSSQIYWRRACRELQTSRS